MLKFENWNSTTDPYYADRSCLAFDLDDTLTQQGELPAYIVDALERCGKKGFLRVLVTGRSAGWADALIKLLPFDAVVAENGAVLRYFPQRRDRRGRYEKAVEEFWSPEGYQKTPPPDIQKQHALASKRILKEVPGTALASDQPYRLYDLAIDFCEEVDPPLSIKDAIKIKDIFEDMGAIAKVSSIHVNGWWGDFSKIEGLQRVLQIVYGLSIKKNLIYVGDSPNDGPLFASEALSVGVANIHEFSELEFSRPHFVTSKKSSEGSLEVIQKCLSR